MMSKRFLGLSCMSALLFVACAQPFATKQPEPETVQHVEQKRFLGLFTADIEVRDGVPTSSQVRAMNTAGQTVRQVRQAAIDNIAVQVINTANLSSTGGSKHYLTTLNVTNNSGANIATPTFVPLSSTRTTGNTYFLNAKDASNNASNPDGITIEQGHHNSGGNIVPDPAATPFKAVSFQVSDFTPSAGETINAVSSHAWQSAALAQGASQHVQFGFALPSTNDTFRFTVLFGVMDSGNTTPTPAVTTAWINEFHYDNASTDVGEFVEVIVPDSMNLADLSLVLYNGKTRAPYKTAALNTFTKGATGAGFAVYHKDIAGIQNGAPDGFALCNTATNQMIQFLSYEGTFPAISGCASGQTSVDVGVQQSGATPTGSSVALTGNGHKYSDFTWTNSDGSNTKGALNTSQTIQ